MRLRALCNGVHFDLAFPTDYYAVCEALALEFRLQPQSLCLRSKYAGGGEWVLLQTQAELDAVRFEVRAPSPCSRSSPP